MNTIEMLKELVENGGMFESVISPDPVTWHRVFGLVWSLPGDDYRRVDVYPNFMKATWKPYVKPVDWSKVPIDTKVRCFNENGVWVNQHFAGLGRYARITTWDGGRTSHTETTRVSGWDDVKLAYDTE